MMRNTLPPLASNDLLCGPAGIRGSDDVSRRPLSIEKASNGDLFSGYMAKNIQHEIRENGLHFHGKFNVLLRKLRQDVVIDLTIFHLFHKRNRFARARLSSS